MDMLNVRTMHCSDIPLFVMNTAAHATQPSLLRRVSEFNVNWQHPAFDDYFDSSLCPKALISPGPSRKWTSRAMYGLFGIC